MRKRLLVFGLLLLVLASCATMGFQGRDSTSYLAFGDKLQSAVTTYKEKEPGLTEDQKREFQEAYAEACKAFQTAGVLLNAILKAGDEESANTAVLSYRRVMTELPDLVNKVVWIVRDFKTAK